MVGTTSPVPTSVVNFAVVNVITATWSCSGSTTSDEANAANPFLSPFGRLPASFALTGKVLPGEGTGETFDPWRQALPQPTARGLREPLGQLVGIGPGDGLADPERDEGTDESPDDDDAQHGDDHDSDSASSTRTTMSRGRRISASS